MQPLGVSRKVLRALLLKTGQTTQYGGYLDDGYYEKGIAKAYSVLTTGQYSGTTNITLNGKTDAHSNNCVLDLNTGLMWSRYMQASIGPASDGKLPWTTNVNGEGIFAFCTAANVAGLAGYSDWRIPNELSLFSLMKSEPPTGFPPVTVWPSWINAFIWSSSTRLDLTTQARAVYFSYASIVYATKTDNYQTLLVRGG